MSTFNLPDLGEGLLEAEIVAWHVAAGEHVVADQPLVSVETEKAVVEIPSPRAGHIAKLGAGVGDRLKVGAMLVEFEDAAPADTGTVVGELGARPGASDVSSVSRALPAPGITRAMAIRAAPAARARAHALGVDLAQVVPTGPDATATLADVERAAAGAAAALRGARHTMALNMARAWAAVAHATVTESVDVDAWARDGDVSARLARAIVAGCDVAPVLNAWFDGATHALMLKPEIDLGIAVDTPHGLLVPVLEDIRSRSLVELRTMIDAAKSAAIARRPGPAARRSPTITLSNFGMLAGLHAALIVLPPQVAILGAGRIAPCPAVHADAIAIRRVMPLSLTFDHRAITGGDAARFLAAVRVDLARTD